MVVNKVKKPRSSGSTDYVDNDAMMTSIKEYKKLQTVNKDLGLEPPRIPEFVGKCLQQMAENYFLKSRFRRYSYREDMISEAVITCIKYFDNFDPDRGSAPFSYFTSIIHMSFFQSINLEERNRYKMLKNFTENVMGGDVASYHSENLISPEELYEDMYSFISNYEAREQAKKDKKKAKNGLARAMEENKKP